MSQPGRRPYGESVAFKVEAADVRMGETSVASRVLGAGSCEGSLAKKLGISRNTIHYWLKTDQLDRELDEEAVCYKKRWPAARKIGRFRGILHSHLEEFPALSAVCACLRSCGRPATKAATHRHPEPRRLPSSAQSAPPAPRPPRSVGLVAVEWIQGDPQ